MSQKEILIDIINDMPEEKIKLIMAYVMEINTDKKGKSFGILSEYANPQLQSIEKEAFKNAMVKKHAND